MTTGKFKEQMLLRPVSTLLGFFQYVGVGDVAPILARLAKIGSVELPLDADTEEQITAIARHRGYGNHRGIKDAPLSTLLGFLKDAVTIGTSGGAANGEDNGFDPVLGPPYAPVDYQLFVHDDPQQPRLTWTVPSLVWRYNAVKHLSNSVIWVNGVNNAATAKAASPTNYPVIGQGWGGHHVWVGPTDAKYFWHTASENTAPTGSGVPLGFPPGVSAGEILYTSGFLFLQVAGSTQGTTTSFTLQRRAFSSDSWVTIATLDGAVRSYVDTAALAPQLQYHLTATTSGGLTLSSYGYNDVSLVWTGTLTAAYVRNGDGTTTTTLSWNAPSLTGDTLGHFFLQRSTNESTWQPVAEVVPTGASSYSAQDSTTPNPVFVYRVLQTTANGVVIPYNEAGVGVPGSAIWVKGFGGSLKDSGSAGAVDTNGNIIVAGYFKGTANFGTPDNTHPATDLVSSGTADMFLAKYNTAGQHLWSYRFGGTSDETVTAIALDASGNIFVAGYYVSGTANFGGSTFTSKLDIYGQSSYDAFIAKYSPSGQHLWSYSFGGANIDGFNCLAVDSQGNVVVAGTFGATYDEPLNFGTPGHPGDNLYNIYTSLSIVMAKYSSNGDHLWSELFEGGGACYANGIAVDKRPNPSNNNVPYDDILLAGDYKGYIVFGNGTATLPDAGGIYPNFFVAKFAMAGSCAWSKGHGTSATSRVTALALDGNGDAIVGGVFYSKTDLGNGQITGMANDVNGFLVKYSGLDGSYLWAQSILGDNGCTINAVTCDAQNNIFATGYFDGTFNFGGTTLSSISYANDVFVAKYNYTSRTALALEWANRYGGLSGEAGTSIALDSMGSAVITGYFNGTADFGGTTLVSAGGADVFLIKLLP